MTHVHVPSCWPADARSLSFMVGGPPVPWQRARLAKNGHHFTEAKTRDYEALLAVHAMAAMRTAGWRLEEEPAAFAVAIVVHWADARPRDNDNASKCLLDACNKLVWRDDSQVKTLHVEQYVDRERPRMEVRIARIEDRDDRKKRKRKSA